MLGPARTYRQEIKDEQNIPQEDVIWVKDGDLTSTDVCYEVSNKAFFVHGTSISMKTGSEPHDLWIILKALFVHGIWK